MSTRLNWACALVTGIALTFPTFSHAREKQEGPPRTIATVAAEPPRYPLSDFLNDVRKQHMGVRGSLEISQGAMQRSAESGLLTSPNLFSNLTYVNDRKPALGPTQPSRTLANSFNLGVSQLTSFGLQGRLYYSMAYTALEGISPMLLGGLKPQYWQGGPVIELSQALWRNGFGRETRATQELLEAGALASSYVESYKVKEILAAGEATYWRLALARETVLVTRDNLQRAQKTRDWNANRVNLSLADRSDLLQAEAAVQARRLELQTAIDEETAASRAFNTVRGSNTDIVPELLERIDEKLIRDFKAPPRVELREDVKAAQQAERIALANATIGREKNSPTVDVFANVAFAGQAYELGDSLAQSVSNDHPTLTAGVRVVVPLATGKTATAREGYLHERQGAQMNYQRKLFDQEREWDDLTHRLNEARNRLGLARMIETAQREKLMNERDRHSRGRTTTFQVLQFEQDYATAQLNRIRFQAEVLNIIARMKTFSPASFNGGQNTGGAQ